MLVTAIKAARPPARLIIGTASFAARVQLVRIWSDETNGGNDEQSSRGQVSPLQTQPTRTQHLLWRIPDHWPSLRDKSDIAWICIAGWIVSFAAGSGYLSTSQEHLTSAMGDQCAAVVSWNNSALYAGTAAGTLLLGMTTRGSPQFTIIAASFGAAATLRDGFVLLQRGLGCASGEG